MIDVAIILIFLTIIAIAVHSLTLSGKNIFEPIYFFLMGFFGVFVLQVYEGREFLLFYFNEDFISYCLFIAWLSLLFFYIGYRSSYAKRLPLKLPHPPAIWPKGKLIPYGIFLLLLGIIGQIFFIMQSGGAEEYYSTARGAGNYEGSTAYIYFAKLMIVIAFPILYIEIARKSASRFTIIFTYITTVLYFLYQVYIGQRSGVFFVGVSVLAWYYLPRIRTSKLPISRVGIVIMLTFLVVGFVAMFRGEFHLGSEFVSTREFFEKDIDEQLDMLVFKGLVRAGGSDESFYTSELAGYLQTMEAVPDLVDHDYGRLYIRYFYAWIPRILWPDKPSWRDSIKELIDTAPAMYCGTNTMLGTYYYNFGLVGILFGSFVTGICLGALEYWRKSQPSNYGILLIYLVFFQYGRGVVMVGGILGGLELVIPFVVLPVMGAFLYLNLSGKSSSKNQEVVSRWRRSYPRY